MTLICSEPSRSTPFYSEAQVLSELSPLIFALLANYFFCPSLSHTSLLLSCSRSVTVPSVWKGSYLCGLFLASFKSLVWCYLFIPSTHICPAFPQAFPFPSPFFIFLHGTYLLPTYHVIYVLLSVFSAPFLLPHPALACHPLSPQLLWFVCCVSSVSRTLPGKYLDEYTTWVECGCVEWEMRCWERNTGIRAAAVPGSIDRNEMRVDGMKDNKMVHWFRDVWVSLFLSF